MPAASIENYADALTAAPGKRPFSDGMAEINEATVRQAPDAYYLHWGSGNFATIFRCTPVSGPDVALRCLLLPPTKDAAERAAAITAYLNQVPQKPDCFVRYRFVPDAIYAANEWQAAYIMEWVEGQTLFEAVGDLVQARDSTRLLVMSNNIARMVDQIQQANIGHGDLQHDNIMVLPTGDLRLVDYDSVYVPALQGRSCPMAGVEGYTHPSYLSSAMVRPFNVYMDTFSGLIIITSLRAIANDLSLFQRFTKENLFFKADDLQDPLGSPAFTALLSQGDTQLAALASSLQAMCLDANKAQMPLAQVRGIVQERKKVPSARIAAPALPLRPSAWIRRSGLGASTFAMIFKQDASA